MELAQPRVLVVLPLPASDRLAEVVQLSRSAAAAETAPAPRPENEEAVDPVCGMTVVVATARHRAEHDGRSYFFCNPRCREKFLLAPERYLSAAAAQP